MKAKVLAEMQRPAALDTAAFVSPGVQCPTKPKGRKPKAVKKTEKTAETASASDVPPRPSAAACGFSTVGMTDKEVHDKLQQMYGDSYGNAATKKQRSSSAGKAKLENVHDSKQVKQDAERGTKKRDKSNSNNKKEQVERESQVEIEAPEVPAVAKKRRRKGTKGKRVRTEEPAGPSKRARNGSKKARKSNANEPTKEEMEEAQRLEAIAARKARISRKSSAYHKAVLAAKKTGASKEEQVAAGKAVS